MLALRRQAVRTVDACPEDIDWDLRQSIVMKATPLTTNRKLAKRIDIEAGRMAQEFISENGLVGQFDKWVIGDE